MKPELLESNPYYRIGDAFYLLTPNGNVLREKLSQPEFDGTILGRYVKSRNKERDFRALADSVMSHTPSSVVNKDAVHVYLRLGDIFSRSRGTPHIAQIESLKYLESIARPFLNEAGVNIVGAMQFMPDYQNVEYISSGQAQGASVKMIEYVKSMFSGHQVNLVSNSIDDDFWHLVNSRVLIGCPETSLFFCAAAGVREILQKGPTLFS